MTTFRPFSSFLMTSLGFVLVLLSTGCHTLPTHSHSCDIGCTSGAEMICETAGCASMDCDWSDCCDAACPSRSSRIVRGRPNVILDKTGSALGTLNKLALWDQRADNHNISPQTEHQVIRYLDRNGLGSTLIRSNQYDPIGEWSRMVANKRIAAGWKYTFGTYDWLKYTVLPGRLLGGDWYNPFSDTVHLYSDIPSIGLSRAAYAKDVHSRTLPGTYAAGQDLPVIGIYHESKANDEVLAYIGRNGSAADLEEARRILIPDLGGSVGAQVAGFLPYGSVVGRAVGAMTGHAYQNITTQ